MDKYQGKYFSIETTNKRDNLNNSQKWYMRRLNFKNPLDINKMQKIMEKEGFNLKNSRGYATEVYEIKERKFLPGIFGKTNQNLVAFFDESCIYYTPKTIPPIIEYGKNVFGWAEPDEGITNHLKFPYLEYKHITGI